MALPLGWFVKANIVPRLPRRQSPDRVIVVTISRAGCIIVSMVHMHPRVDSLSRRESEVALLAATGMTGPEIACRLTVSINTVKTHLRSIYQKVGVTNRIQLEHYMIDGDRVPRVL
jgi:DNA-binding NarL/FixJ family response regulator